MVTIVYCPSCLFSETWFSEQISFNYRFLKIIILSKGIQDWVLQIFHHRMKRFIAKKDPISEHQRGNGINIFTTQYFSLSILLKIISLKKHESSKQLYR